jgi:hypothetical protein
VNVWRHVTTTFNVSTGAVFIRVRDTAGEVVGSDYSGTFSDTLAVTTAPMFIGTLALYGNPYAGTAFDGLVDEVVIFNDVLTEAESTAIAKGRYPL